MSEPKPPSPTKKIGDLSDAISGGMSAPDLIRGFLGERALSPEELRARVEAGEAELRPPFDRATAVSKRLPTIPVNRLDSLEVIHRGWEALFEANRVPWLFRRARKLVMVNTDDDDPRVVVCGRNEVQGFLLRAARWVMVGVNNKTGEETERPSEVPRHIAQDMVAIPTNRLPVLTDLVRCPTFDAGGRLVTIPGYHEESGLFLAPGRGYVPPTIPHRPGSADVRLARSLLVDHWLGDFPFVSEADRTHAVALFLLPLVRRMIAGPTPLHWIEAAAPGTGKSLLARTLVTPALGASPEAMTLGKDPEETRKKITSLLLASRQVILLDNLDLRVDSSDLAAVLTTETWGDRLLNSNDPANLPNRATWIATLNNGEASTDIARRSVRIKLIRNMERPSEWRGARIPRLEHWTLQHRGELLSAGLTLVQAWIAAGRPTNTACDSLGSFEDWSATIGGIVANAGLPDFLANVVEMRQQADTVGAEWRGFVRRWWDVYGDTLVHAEQLAELADREGLLATVLSASKPEGRSGQFGKAARKMRDRIVSGVKLTLRPSDHKTGFRLECVDPGAMAWARRPPPASG